MTIIRVKTADQLLSAVLVPKLAQNNQNSVRLTVDFDSAWDGYGKSAVFYTDSNPAPFEKVLDSNGACMVPQEVLAEPGYIFVTIKGVKTSDNSVKASARLKVKVSDGMPQIVVSEPTKDVYSQLLFALAGESARINNLLANGGTSNGDEVVDARVGVGNEIHGTAGTAIREQLKPFCTTIVPALEIGTLSEGVVGQMATRAVMSEPLRAYRTVVKCSENSDYMFGYAVYDKYGKYDGVDHGWNTINGRAIVFEDCYFRMNFRRVDGAEITSDDIETLQSLFVITEFSALNDIADLKESVNDGYKVPLSFELELGSISDGVNAAFATRARFAEKVKVTPKTVATIKPNYTYMYGYAFYDDNGVYDGVDRGWNNPVVQSTVTFPKIGYVRFNFRRVDGAEITENDISEIAELVTIVDKNNIADVVYGIEETRCLLAEILKSAVFTEDVSDKIGRLTESYNSGGTGGSSGGSTGGGTGGNTGGNTGGGNTGDSGEIAAVLVSASITGASGTGAEIGNYGNGQRATLLTTGGSIKLTVPATGETTDYSLIRIPQNAKTFALTGTADFSYGISIFAVENDVKYVQQLDSGWIDMDSTSAEYAISSAYTDGNYYIAVNFRLDDYSTFAADDYKNIIGARFTF